MKTTLLGLAVFALGFGHAVWDRGPTLPEGASAGILIALLGLVGLGLGLAPPRLVALRRIGRRTAACTVGAILGTALGGLLTWSLTDRFAFFEVMSAGAGYGYYSVSSVILREVHSPALATLALFANMMRELLSLLFMPVLVPRLGANAGIAMAGVTAMDTNLAGIARAGGTESIAPAVLTGLMLTVLVPPLVPLLVSLSG